MVYSNPEFVLLFLSTLGAYLIAPGRSARFAVLLLASLVFYSWAGLADGAIFLAVVAVSWLAVALARRYPGRRRFFIRAGITVMLGHLFFWKYASWAAGQVQRVWPAFLGGAEFHLPLPVGISFFTLQGIAYLADYASNDAKYMGFSTYLLFKSFFAQLVAGPIVRARQLLPQLERLERPSREDLSAGLALFTLGFFKKLVMADRMGRFVDEVFLQPEVFRRAVLLRAILAYSVQIWADFSGYTDMGRGAARMLGIRLPENFLSPYLARSPSEFWRRWHITLSEWIRDYLYIPLGGSRGSKARAALVAVLTFALCGLWHGASWHFLVWGLYHGLLLVIERRSGLGEPSIPGLPARLLRVAAMFTLVSFGWLIFRADSIPALLAYIQALVFEGGTAPNSENGRWVYCFLALTFLINAAGYRELETGRRPALVWLGDTRAWKLFAARPALASVLGALLAAAFAGSVFFRVEGGGAFIYFQF